MFSQNNQTNTTVMECAQFILPTAMGTNAPSDDLSEDMEGLRLTFPKVKIPRAEERRKETERKYLKTLRARPPDPFEELEAKLLLHDLAAVSSKEQYALASMRLQGYSIAETACIQGMSEKRVRGLLRELYWVYMCLYT